MPAFNEGAPCWADVALPDLAAGRAFYGELFGWTFQDQGEEFGHYTMALRDGAKVAALVPRPDPSMPTAWGVFLAVADVADTTDKVRAVGGQVAFGPDAVADSGVMAGIVDPGGSFVGLWQPGGHEGFERVAAPGAYAWSENHTREAEAVDAFYRDVFGYASQQVGDGVHLDYRVWSVPGAEDPSLGRLKLGDAPEEDPGYQVYFAVGDCDDAAATVRRLGGQVLAGPAESPYGRTAVVADDQGARFAVIDLERRSDGTPGR
ncbi:putative hydroxylase [Actinacidiphila reveromycinica]|uniref:Putative hydroxylase n=1 Tax=Actinacidiphila reveromycinica TaxID=659352 RepID=A0A7U3VNQ9_9ACTN|nr:VOC family protein [Streptomyces sp. SN-593]BBA97903.1 putative hydroxylase [Streptomyces sp. SN-593]